MKHNGRDRKYVCIVVLVKNVPISCKTLGANLDFSIGEESPFDVIVGRPAMRGLGYGINFANDTVQLNHQELS